MIAAVPAQAGTRRLRKPLASLQGADINAAAPTR